MTADGSACHARDSPVGAERRTCKALGRGSSSVPAARILVTIGSWQSANCVGGHRNLPARGHHVATAAMTEGERSLGFYRLGIAPVVAVSRAGLSARYLMPIHDIDSSKLHSSSQARAPIAADADVRWGRAPHARSAVKHRPADVVPQPLVVKHELANRLRELVTLPVALESPCGLALAFWRGSTCGLDRIGGCTEFVCRDVCDGPGLASSVRGTPCCPAQVPGRAHCMATRRASLHHLDLTTHPGAGVLDRFTRS
jgi:hypothetical protein